MKGIIGKKVGMTQVFDETGAVIPVTVIGAGPCYVTQVKTSDVDGYDAVQVGFDPTKKLLCFSNEPTICEFDSIRDGASTLAEQPENQEVKGSKQTLCS